MGGVDEKHKNSNIFDSNHYNYRKRHHSQVIYSEKPIRYNYQTNNNSNRPSLSSFSKENFSYKDEPILKSPKKIPDNNIMQDNSLRLIFIDEVPYIQNSTDMNYMNDINGINYIYDNIGDINNNMNNLEINPTNEYNSYNLNYDYQENEYLDIPKDTLVLKFNPEINPFANVNSILDNNYDYKEIINGVNNNAQNMEIKNQNLTQNSNNKNFISTSNQVRQKNTNTIHNNLNLTTDNNINYSLIDEPVINFGRKKKVLENPLKSENANNNVYKTKRIEKSSNINKLSINKSIDKDIVDYCNKKRFKEIEDFSPELWRKFYPKDELFFEYNKGDTFVSEIKSENNLGETEIYIGDLNQNGEKNGFGKLFSPKKKRIGTWRNNQFTGWGREVRDNGDIYEGRFEKGELIGKGIFKNRNITYIGDFYKFIKHGKGDQYTNKYHYRGDFLNNKIHGKGRIDMYNVGVYEGTFKDDEITGKGILMMENGNIYEGEIKNGKMVGNVKIITKSTVTYEKFSD